MTLRKSTFNRAFICPILRPHATRHNPRLRSRRPRLGAHIAPVEQGAFDFFATGSDAGDTKFNLRHARVEVGGLGFGQTNSNFMDIPIFPNVVDWWGPSDMAFNRNPQQR